MAMNQTTPKLAQMTQSKTSLKYGPLSKKAPLIAPKQDLPTDSRSRFMSKPRLNTPPPSAPAATLDDPWGEDGYEDVQCFLAASQADEKVEVNKPSEEEIVALTMACADEDDFDMDDIGTGVDENSQNRLHQNLAIFTQVKNSAEEKAENIKLKREIEMLKKENQNYKADNFRAKGEVVYLRGELAKTSREIKEVRWTSIQREKKIKLEMEIDAENELEELRERLRKIEKNDNKKKIKKKEDEKKKNVHYSCLVASETLISGTLEREEKEEIAKDMSMSRTDEELVKSCGELTVHESARHGDKLNAKFLGVQEIDWKYVEEVEDKQKNKEKSFKVKKKKKKTDRFMDSDLFYEDEKKVKTSVELENVPVEAEKKKKKKSKRKKHLESQENKDDSRDIKSLELPAVLKKKKSKEDQKVVRPVMTPFAWFIQVCDLEYRKKYPEEQILEFDDIHKSCSDRWETMTELDKKRFHEMAASDRRRYVPVQS